MLHESLIRANETFRIVRISIVSYRKHPKILEETSFLCNAHIARIYTKVQTNPDKVQGDKHVSTAIWQSASQLVNPVIAERGYCGLHVETKNRKHCLLSIIKERAEEQI